MLIHFFVSLLCMILFPRLSFSTVDRINLNSPIRTNSVWDSVSTYIFRTLFKHWHNDNNLLCWKSPSVVTWKPLQNEEAELDRSTTFENSSPYEQEIFKETRLTPNSNTQRRENMQSNTINIRERLRGIQRDNAIIVRIQSPNSQVRIAVPCNDPSSLCSMSGYFKQIINGMREGQREVIVTDNGKRSN